MVGKFGGAAFVLFYVVVSLVIGVPALMAEIALGRYTRRGPVGAFERGGFPSGRYVGWFLFFVVTAATGYYSAVIGWVMYYAIGRWPSSRTSRSMPRPSCRRTRVRREVVGPADDLHGRRDPRVRVVSSAGVRKGIELVSTHRPPRAVDRHVVVMMRSLTLPGAMAGVRWYMLEFRCSDLTAERDGRGHRPRHVRALARRHVHGGVRLVPARRTKSSRAPHGGPSFGDTGSALLAGLAVIPAVFALGLEPASGPGLISRRCRKCSGRSGRLAVRLLFFVSLFGAGYLSGARPHLLAADHERDLEPAATRGRRDGLGAPRARVCPGA